MPFVWRPWRKGQLLGQPGIGKQVAVRNKYWFSYPGRSESFTGYYDSAVNSTITRIIPSECNWSGSICSRVFHAKGSNLCQLGCREPDPNRNGIRCW